MKFSGLIERDFALDTKKRFPMVVPNAPESSWACAAENGFIKARANGNKRIMRFMRLELFRRLKPLRPRNASIFVEEFTRTVLALLFLSAAISVGRGSRRAIFKEGSPVERRPLLTRLLFKQIRLPRLDAQPERFFNIRKRNQPCRAVAPLKRIVAHHKLPSISKWSVKSARCAAAVIKTDGFDHTANHGFEPPLFAPLVTRRKSAGNAGRLEQFDIHPVEALSADCGVARGVIRFVAKNRQRRAAFEPGEIADRHRRAGIGCSMNSTRPSAASHSMFRNAFLLGCPAFIGVHADDLLRSRLAQRRQILPVLRHADFKF